MPIYKTKLIFSSTTGSGWSESWYNNAAADINAAAKDADLMAKQRIQMCGKGNSIPSWSVLDVTQPRFSITRDGLLPAYVSNKFPTDRPAGSQLGVCTCAPFAGRRQFWMRGIPDDWVVWDPEVNRYVLVPDFVEVFKTFRKFVVNSKWCLRTVKGYKASVMKSEVAILTTDVGSGFASLTLRLGGTLPEKVDIVVGGFRKPLSHLNGTYLWPNGYTRNAVTIVLQGRYVTDNQAFQYVSGGTVRMQEFAYQPITLCNYSRRGGRKVGKILGVPAGRR